MHCQCGALLHLEPQSFFVEVTNALKTFPSRSPSFMPILVAISLYMAKEVAVKCPGNRNCRMIFSERRVTSIGEGAFIRPLITEGAF